MRLSTICVGESTSIAIAMLSATIAWRRAFRARIRSTRALATSTSARATSDLGRVPTSKKPLADRRFSSARSTACSCTRIKRWLNSVFVYASFTVSEISWRCSSTSSTATSASLRAASVAASVLPKSKRSWENCTCARKLSLSDLLLRVKRWGLLDWLLTLLPVDVVPAVQFSLRLALTSPLIWGRSGDRDWLTRKRAAAESASVACTRGCASSASAMHSPSVSNRPATCVEVGAGAGAAGVEGGVCALAPLENTPKTKSIIGVNAATPRGRDIGTREYHARSTRLDTLAVDKSVDARWIPFFLTNARFSVLDSPTPQDLVTRAILRLSLDEEALHAV